MACLIERPDPRTLFESLKTMFSTNVLGGANVIPESNEWYVVSNDYATAEQFFSIGEQQWKERDPRYACCDNLIDMAAIDGVYPRPAMFAEGYIQITGAPLSSLASSIEATIGGNAYISIGSVPASLDTSGNAVLRMRALEPGPDSNLKAGTTTGTLTTQMTGVNSTVTVYGGQFCGGAIAEECEPFRIRYLERLRYKPKKDLAWVKEKLLEWPCVTSVCERAGSCCYPEDVKDWETGIDCNRPIRLYAMFDSTFPCGAAPQNIIDDIDEWMFGLIQGIGQGEAPIGVVGKIYSFKGAYVNIKLDGLVCTTPAIANEIRERLTEYVARICPSQTLLMQDLKAIVAQLMLGTGNFEVVIEKADPNYEHIMINYCGDAEPDCDYRICLNTIEFVNPEGGV
jgi:hypothetical protein